ncbi:MAG TPA: DUF748 domain-containing protein, partial [Steroidobacteraceae bacterium]|nr:DUF748 domain-containing protein [Steroidobacteraceae bacterium]
MLTSPEHTEASFVRRHRILLGIIAAIILLYGALGFLWLPSVIRNQAIEFVDKELHKHLSLGEVTFNPFTLTLHISNIKLSEANDIPIATVNDLLVNAELSSLWRRAYAFKQVRIEAPALNAIINKNGELNLANIKPASSATTDNAPASLPRIRIDQFELLQGQVKFADFSRPKPFDAELKPITFTLQSFRTEPDHENAFHFAAISDEKESLDWRGDFTVQPFTANGQLKIGSLKATTIQSYLQDKLPFQLLDGTVTLDGSYELKLANSLSFNLKLPNISVNNARVAPKNTNGTEAWVTLPEVKLNDTAVSLQDQNVTIKSIAVQNADIKAVLDEKRNLNLLQLLGDDTEKSDSPWHAKVDEILLEAATIHATDQGVKPATQFTLSPAQVHLQNFSTAPGSAMSVDTKLTVDGAAELTAKGSVQLDTQESQLAIQLNNFSLPSMQNYIFQTMDLIVQEGKLSSAGNFNYRGSAKNKNPLMQYAGWVNIDGLATQDKADETDFVKWKQLQLLNLKYAMSPDQLTIDQIVVHQPYIRMAINANATTNVQQILRKAPRDDSAPVEATVANTPPPMKIRIGKVTLDKGVTDFSDDTVKPGFSAGIQNLNGEINGMSSKDETRATVNLQGSVDNYAPVSISGEANFLSASTYSDLSLKFRNIELTTFNPYSGKYAGYDINKGKLT